MRYKCSDSACINYCWYFNGTTIKGIEWDNIVYAASGFMTVIFMILAYSISNGIAIGFITYTVSMIGVGKIKEIKPIVWILDICFVIFLVFLPK